MVTLFAPTNEAFQQYVAAYNETGVQAMTEPPRGGEAAAFLVDGLELHIATEALPVLSWTPHCPNLASYCSFECIRLHVIMTNLPSSETSKPVSLMSWQQVQQQSLQQQERS